MEFRKAVESDMDGIMNIFRQAQAFLRENGVNQWQNGYPNPDTIRDDLENHYGYVLAEEDKVLGTAAVSFDGEKTYQCIHQGQWISRHDYAVIHRMAVDNQCRGKGLSSIMIKNIEEICLKKGVHSIRVDTHRGNLPMQKVMKKNGFAYCGLIYLEDNSERMAFEKILQV